MIDIFKPYILSFIPIFVAVNAFGIMPLFIGLTEKLHKHERRKVVVETVITATMIAIAFILIGRFIFNIMGISVADFKIAGGILLLILSINLLLPGDHKRGRPTTDVGVFPLGTPLVTGPAVLTTLLVLMGTYGFITTFIALVLNMLLVWLIFLRADFFIKLTGKGGAKALSKVADILLSAFAVMMMRRGIEELIRNFVK